MSGLATAVRTVLDEAAALYAGTVELPGLLAARTQLDGPLRVAFAGRLKAGKSTLLNALVGEGLAATDATECTRVVTWYVSGPATRAWAFPRSGDAEQLRFGRSGGATSIDLGRFDAAELDRLVVETPNARLRQLTLVDTPGIASSSVEVSAATREFLVDGAPGVDAVLYLMRHVHAEDVGFLQSFHDDAFARTAPVNAIGVLSRADEMSGGAPNALDVAATIADRYAADDRVRAVVQTVLPVSGLLALAAVRLSEPQFVALQQVSAAPPSQLLSADRFLRAAGDPALEVRAELMDAFGMFGIRHAVGLIRLGRATDAATLARVLQAECGLEELRRLLAQRFLGRAEVLKAEAALRVVEAAVTRVPVDGADQLRYRIEAVIAGAHELTELRTVTALRTGALELESAEQSAEVERLLGADGDSVRQRLGLAAEVPDEELRPALIATIQRWQRVAVDPFADAATRRVAAVVRRSCEGLLSGNGG